MSDSLFRGSAVERIAAEHARGSKSHARRGFDCILGNPPWERVKLQEKEWFAERVPEIANAPNAAARTKMIKVLSQERPELHAQFLADVRAAEAASAFMRGSGRYPLCGRGDVNLYTVFAESMRDGVSPAGRVGCIVPSGIATDDTTKFFFQDLVDRASLASLFDFENREGLFDAVDSRMKFSCLTLRAPAPDADAEAKAPPAEFVFFAHKVEDLADERRRFTLTRDEIALVNPNTKTCPIFRSKVDAELTKYIYRRVPVLVDENKPDGNPWGVEFTRLFDMSNDSDLFRTREQLEKDGWKLRGNVFKRGAERYLPLYEAKMIDFFDHRAANVVLSATAQIRQGQPEAFGLSDYVDASRVPSPRSWVASAEVFARLAHHPACLLGLRDITSPTNERTVIASALPVSAVGNNLPLVLTPSPVSAALLGCLNAFAHDFVARFKVGGLHLNFFIVKQFPVLSERSLGGIGVGHAAWSDWASVRVLELSATADDMAPFSKGLWPEGDGAVFRYDPERRFEIRCELDAAFFHLYLGTVDEWKRSASSELLQALPTPRDALAYIMETFPIVKRRDEDAHGHYRTKDRILALYDTLTNCLAARQLFKSTLSPPPGPPTNADGSFAALPAWPKGAPKPANWPAHIHPPVSHRSL